MRPIKSTQVAILAATAALAAAENAKAQPATADLLRRSLIGAA